MPAYEAVISNTRDTGYFVLGASVEFCLCRYGRSLSRDFLVFRAGFDLSLLKFLVFTYFLLFEVVIVPFLVIYCLCSNILFVMMRDASY